MRHAKRSTHNAQRSTSPGGPAAIAPQNNLRVSSISLSARGLATYLSQPRRRKYHMGTSALQTMSASEYG